MAPTGRRLVAMKLATVMPPLMNTEASNRDAANLMPSRDAPKNEKQKGARSSAEARGRSIPLDSPL